MSSVLIIGAGGVGRVVAHKCAKNSEVFKKITLASRTLSKCYKIKKEVKEKTNIEINTAKLDADKSTETVKLIKKIKADLVINVALPYQDLSIMDACLETGVDYLDTANYESPEEARFEYKWQWDYQDKFKKSGLMALLGSGFDPGVTNVFCAFADRYRFDEIKNIDILDANAGDHGYPFATNFNPEINIREVSQEGKFWEKGKWVKTDPMSVRTNFNFPEVGERMAYLMYHEEMESLVKHIKGLKRIRFWMTFGDSYLNYLKVLKNVGMTRIDPVEYNGKKIIPLKFLKKVLPDPSSLGSRTKGKTVIGCIIDGKKNGKNKKLYIYNICNHEKAFKETFSQAVSYTTGVPAMIGAKMILENKWKRAGVWNMEQFDPKPFMDELNIQGLPWQEKELPKDFKIITEEIPSPIIEN